MMKLAIVFRREPVLIPLLFLLTLIWVVPHTPLSRYIEKEIQRQYAQLPAVKVDLHPHQTWASRYSNNRTVLYIETRDHVKHITPLLLHMTQVVPPEWRFLFIGTPDIIEKANTSSAVRRMKETGKLRMENVERWTPQSKKQVGLEELHSRMLTNITFYNEQLPNVEHLLVFRSNSIICANADRTVNDFLEYDWVGAPWDPKDKFGGNGGLSLRKVSKVREVLSFQTRPDDTKSEDIWLSHRIGLLPNANNANATIAAGFSVEDIWHEEPLGYHINPSLRMNNGPDVWDQKPRRDQIFKYCPEIKIILDMRLQRERCPDEN